MKKTLCVLLVIAVAVCLMNSRIVEQAVGSAVFLFLSLTSDDSEDRAEIIAFVLDHHDELMTCIQDNDFSVFENHKFIKEINPKKDVVDFYCGGAGIGSATSYCGFYYTPENDIYSIWCAPGKNAAMAASGDGFLWEEKNGDNRYYTEQICDCFYYYEASF